MNLGHFNAIVRMRWQMARNQFKKSGQANQIISTILLLMAIVSSVCSFIFAIGWGWYFLAKIDPFYVIYVWDALCVLFLFGWAITLMVEIQRTEMLSLKNLLHLPISLKSAFFLNYTSSLVSLVLLLFLPGAVGLCFASVVEFGIGSFVVFPLLAAFLLMVTAVTYQLRGWLARLMENKRTRGTVISATIMVFVLVFQIPNLINLSSMASRNAGKHQLRDAREQQISELQLQLTNGEIVQAEFLEQKEVVQQDYDAGRQKQKDAETAAINTTAELVNLVLPVGWLPYGASAAAHGAVITPWLCVFGMSGIGLVSLTLAHRSTIRAYTGYHNKGHRARVQKDTKESARSQLMEWRFPLLSDQQSAVSLATFRSTLRAPEAKMALLTPLIFACVFGSIIFTSKLDSVPQFVRPWIGVGALGISVIGMTQLMLNMFGLDRQGFRAYVLMPVQRRDILMGKNLGSFPISATLSAMLIVFMGVAAEIRVTHVIATVLQIGVTFFLYYTISNYTSIVAPIGMAVGTMKPVSMNLKVVVAQMVAVFLTPVTLLPAVIALGTEQLTAFATGMTGMPIYLLVTLAEIPVAIWCYRKILTSQGELLHRHEQNILSVISKVSD